MIRSDAELRHGGWVFERFHSPSSPLCCGATRSSRSMDQWSLSARASSVGKAPEGCQAFHGMWERSEHVNGQVLLRIRADVGCERAELGEHGVGSPVE